VEETPAVETSRRGVSLAAAVIVFFGLLLSSELVCRVLTASGALHRRADFSGALTSLADVRDRVRAFANAPRRVVLLGDSVLGGTALWEHDVPRPRAVSLGAELANALRERGRTALHLGADGLLLPDIDTLAREAAEPAPESVLLLLNARMFAPEYQAAGKERSRDFLAGPPRAGLEETQLSRRVFEGASRNVALFRTTQLLRTIWYFPTQ
jgi:hypothetical protein